MRPVENFLCFCGETCADFLCFFVVRPVENAWCFLDALTSLELVVIVGF